VQSISTERVHKRILLHVLDTERNRKLFKMIPIGEFDKCALSSTTY
jgi:hypothetical protein